MDFSLVLFKPISFFSMAVTVLRSTEIMAWKVQFFYGQSLNSECKTHLSEFYVHVTVHCNKFLLIKPTRCNNFTNLFCHETLHASDNLSIIRSLFTVHSAMVYVIQVCRQLSSSSILVLLESCLLTCMTYTIAECTVNYLLTMDRRTVRNM